MRLRVESLTLVGGGRTVAFTPGLNLVIGPIATGKSTLLALIRILLGQGIESFQPEVRQNVRAIAGSVRIGDADYSIVRPFVQTPTARVHVAGPSGESLRVPAMQREQPEEQTYGDWLLQRLGLPRIEVPLAPTRAETTTSPLSINDFLRYCDLDQNQIDKSVYGHDEHFRNNKRKYVFAVLYGLYGARLAELEERRRRIVADVRRLSQEGDLFERFLQGTPLENAAEIDRDIDVTETKLREITQSLVALPSRQRAVPRADETRERILALDAELEKARQELNREHRNAEEIRRVREQLEVQSARLTRSIVANERLVDFEFILCPRCGSDLSASRGGDGICLLCLQEERGLADTATLVREQDRLSAQVSEAERLLRDQRKTQQQLELRLSSLQQERTRLGAELDVLTASYVSDAVRSAADLAAERAELQSRLGQLREYRGILAKIEALRGEVASLEAERRRIEGEIQQEEARRTEIEERIVYLEGQMNAILDAFGTPRFITPAEVRIDRETYLPVVDGRRFDELQSQGLKVLVNVAHAVAHQLTAIRFDLPLPNILLIDGLSSNVGHEGIDLDRIRAVYRHLVQLGTQLGGRLQIIAADHADVPAEVKPFVRLELRDDSKLIVPEAPSSQS